MAISPATRDTALFTSEPTLLSSTGVFPNAVVVVGATVNASPAILRRASPTVSYNRQRVCYITMT